MIITIDGPAASGKSTVARALADTNSYYYLNSGFLFRGLAYVLLECAGYTKETINNPKAADIDYYLDKNLFSYVYTSQEGPNVIFKGQVITPFLKTERIDQCASRLSANAYVRTKLHNIQRAFAQGNSLVAEGRDMGSIVFPDADYKFFITASIAVRAKRWQADQAKKGAVFSYEQAEQEISQRDERDLQRTHAPLVTPADARVIDTSDLTIEQVLNKIYKIISVKV